MSDSIEKQLQDVQAQLAQENQGGQQPVLDSNVGSSEVAEQLSQLEVFAQMDPSVRESKEYKDLVALSQQQSSQADSDEDEDSEEEDEDDEDEEEDEDDELVDESNPFLAEKPAKKAKAIPINFEVPKEFSEVLEKHFGLKDLPTFLNSAQTWRAQAQERNALLETQEAINADLIALPYELKNAISIWAEGGDYLTPLVNQKRLDFEGDFSQQETETLVEHYHPEQYDDLVDQLEKGLSEEEFMKQINLLGRATKQAFEKDKKAFKKERDDYAESIERRQKSFEKSALVSVETLSKTYPSFSKTELNKIRSVLTEGKLDGLFYNPDGTYKAEAAQLIAFALNGEKLLNTVKGKAKREGMSEANQEYVDKSPKSLKKGNKAGGNTQQIDMSEISHLTGVFSKSPYAG